MRTTASMCAGKVATGLGCTFRLPMSRCYCCSILILLAKNTHHRDFYFKNLPINLESHNFFCIFAAASHQRPTNNVVWQRWKDRKEATPWACKCSIESVRAGRSI